MSLIISLHKLKFPWVGKTSFLYTLCLVVISFSFTFPSAEMYFDMFAYHIKKLSEEDL